MPFRGKWSMLLYRKFLLFAATVTNDQDLSFDAPEHPLIAHLLLNPRWRLITAAAAFGSCSANLELSSRCGWKVERKPGS